MGEPFQSSNYPFKDSFPGNSNETQEDPYKLEPFPTNVPKEEEEEENLDPEINDPRFFRNPKTETNETKNTKETKDSTKTKISDPPKTKPIFKTPLVVDPPNNMLKKKRGRKPLIDNQEKNEKRRKKQPRKYCYDNIIRKIQTHGFNYIQVFINCLLKKLGIKHRFKKIAYYFKKNSNFEYFESLKGKTLGDILQLKISEKYTKIDKNHNLKIYEKIKDIPVIKNVLKENYMTFFKEVYYKSERKISLKKYGSDEILTLYEEINTYKDKVNSFDDKKYAEIYEATIRQLYINGNNNINDSCI